MERWIKLYRKFLEWEWSDVPEMVSLFIHLILLANTSDSVWHGIEYKKGQLITSIDSLSKKTGLSVQQVRTCLNRLKSTNEITITSTNKNTIITICKYESYQANTNEDNKQNNEQINKQITNKQQTNNKQITTDIEYKNIKNIRNIKEENKEENVAADAATNEQKLCDRKEKFLNELAQYYTTYGKETVKAFADYWTEPNRSMTKMRFELQPTWNTKLRLSTWARREQPAQSAGTARQQSSNGRISPAQALKDLRAKYGKQLENNTEEAQFELL